MWAYWIDGVPFLAIDFELANESYDSACAVGFAVTDGTAITHSDQIIVRPPSLRFTWSHLHGIDAELASRSASFPEAWRQLTPMLSGAAFIAAHNANFDRAVLRACCRAYGLLEPTHSWVCSAAIARRRLGLRRTGLANVCRVLQLPLEHHNAESDAHACAAIILRTRTTQLSKGPLTLWKGRLLGSGES